MRRAVLSLAALVACFAGAAHAAEVSARPAAASAVVADALPNQTVVFYNARIALREKRPLDVLKLWLIRNSLEQRGEPGIHDDEFRSVVWAALGEVGICQDGLPEDDLGGAGLWPLAVHNWLVQAMVKGPPPDNPAPWDVFEVGRQQRFVSLNDVLSEEELRSVTFFRTSCLLPHTLLLELKQSPLLDVKDRLSVGLLMRQMLERARETLVRQKVPSLAVIDARIFDLDLAIADLQTRRARREGREVALTARNLGVSEAGAAELRKKVASWPESSKQAEFLRHSLTWKPSEWLSLSRPRRLSLFAQARPLAKDKPALDALVLSMIDELIARGAGEELTEWIGFLDAAQDPALRTAVTSGERGRRLLELEPTTGFRERSVVALHRGVELLESGDLRESLRSFAYAMQHAEESREATVTLALGRRWLSYVLSRYETSTEVVATLKALVPRQEFNAVVEDLVWRAALRADRTSFERVTALTQKGGSFDTRIERLRPLAQGKPGEMATLLRNALEEEPHSVLRFVRQLIENLEAEDGDVRIANAATLKLVIAVLDPLASETEKKNAHTRNAAELQDRAQSILDGLNYLDVSEQGKARSMSPDRETFAGSIRLAPADRLPWPFRIPEPAAPSAFTQLKLEPIEWRDEQGALVFGWRITE